MWPLTRLIWRGFFRRAFVPIMAFVFPIIIYLIIRFVIPFGNTISDFVKANYIIPGIMLYTPMVLGTTVLPVAIMQFKESVIIKRIGVTPINKKLLTITFALNYVVLAVLGSLMFLAFASAVEAMSGTLSSGQLTRQQEIRNTVGVVTQTIPAVTMPITSFFLAGEGIPLYFSVLLLGIIMSILFGLMISALSKSLQMAQSLGMLIFLPCMFLTGMFFPLKFDSGPGLVAWISPWRSIVVLMQMAWFGTGSSFSSPPVDLVPTINSLSSSLFGVNDAANLYIGKSELATWLGVALGIGFTVFFMVISLWKFKWKSIRS